MLIWNKELYYNNKTSDTISFFKSSINDFRITGTAYDSFALLPINLPQTRLIECIYVIVKEKSSSSTSYIRASYYNTTTYSTGNLIFELLYTSVGNFGSSFGIIINNSVCGQYPSVHQYNSSNFNVYDNIKFYNEYKENYCIVDCIYQCLYIA